jgi:hypothetical protein
MFRLGLTVSSSDDGAHPKAGKVKEDDMSMINTEEQLPPLSAEARQKMDEYGITRVPTDTFTYREFRYTNLQDALAQAKRDADARS